MIHLIGDALVNMTWEDWLGFLAVVAFVAWIAWERWLMERPPE